ncbi:hypothetical protein FOC1_g10010755 [Fusarium oxysporum f. sp. cubense race 1]|uniref:Uncharacterized protein n=1 Tax=Fusarium oxysporum f. sp. cubense (strain race 1) TaxID=1229664 RepID=N4TX67_FUSC1|nr:hypothetical protein FOC1_g10010755 [Fusarium oxysporum f. sp. cubense race 1]
MWSPPCDEAIPLPKQSHHDSQRSRQASTCSERSCEGMSLDETRELWRCMLELQLRYGCYNSTRIDMAIDAGECGVDLMPNRFIIDTLNESVIVPLSMSIVADEAEVEVLEEGLSFAYLFINWVYGVDGWKD